MYHLERVQERAESYVRGREYSSVAWMIERGGEVLTEGCAGQADAIAGVPLPHEPIYRIFSMTKPLVSAVGVMLIDEGRLRLADPVEMYLPGFGAMEVMEADGTTRPARGAMLIEHLFTHRSGLTYQWQPNDPVAKLYAERVMFADRFTLAELVDSLAEVPLFADPGTAWRYSFSTDVLAQVICAIEGKLIEQVLRDRLFAPLGMTETGYFVPDAERTRLLPMFGDPYPPQGAAPRRMGVGT